jgi:hypothetical protein
MSINSKRIAILNSYYRLFFEIILMQVTNSDEEDEQQLHKDGIAPLVINQATIVTFLQDPVVYFGFS